MNAADRNTIIFGIPKLPARYATLVLPLLLSIFMSGIVSLISTFKGIGPSPQFASKWLSAWGLSWIVAYPVLLLILPVVRKVTSFLVRAA